MNFKKIFIYMQKEKLAILVPYRNRKEQLDIFSLYMNNFMKNNFPKVDYKIVIIEQYDNHPFNRGKLLNIGSLLSKNYDYFILHDIDMLPISSDYSYSEKIWHLARNVYDQSNDCSLQKNYIHKLSHYAGGVLKIPKTIFYDINGFDNEYWGWGGEDDELKIRIVRKGYPMLFWSDDSNLSHFISLSHKSNFKKYKDGDELYDRNYERSMDSNKGKNDPNKNGLNTLNYKIVKSEHKDLYDMYSVDTCKK